MDAYIKNKDFLLTKFKSELINNNKYITEEAEISGLVAEAEKDMEKFSLEILGSKLLRSFEEQAHGKNIHEVKTL